MITTAQSASTSPSRRAVLAGAIGGVGAWMLSAARRATPVRAADGEAIETGGEYTSTSVTKITNGTNGDYVIEGASSSGVGVRGTGITGRGVLGQSDSSYGVHASSFSATALFAESTSHIGVYGSSAATDKPAVAGRTLGNSTGVLGSSGTGGVPTPKAATGVYGYAAQTNGTGVWGSSPTGRAVRGSSDTGWAGYFSGRIYTSRYHEMQEVSAPGAPGVDKARIFLRDNGAGKTQLCVRFNTGAIQVLATQP